MSTRRAPRRGRGSASLRSLVDRMMRASYPDRSEEWLGRQVDSAMMVTKAMTGRPVAAAEAGDPQYSTSTASGGGNCVEVAQLPNGSVLVRDSKNPTQPPLHMSHEEFRALVEDIKKGMYDKFA